MHLMAKHCLAPALAFSFTLICGLPACLADTPPATQASDVAVTAAADSMKNTKATSADKAADKAKAENEKTKAQIDRDVVKPKVSAKQQQLDAETAAGINKTTGANLKPDLTVEHPLPPIRGFHPIKRILRPVEQLEQNSTELQKQIVRLEGPIAVCKPQ